MTSPSLYGLQVMGLVFELKGGTSLSKGFDLIHRFSEDIDIRIEPPPDQGVKFGQNHMKPAHCKSRKNYYDWLAHTIVIHGIEEIVRDHEFDDHKYRSGGVRLNYRSSFSALEGLKDGILLEIGFDDVTPNQPKDISSWAYDYAVEHVELNDNRAKQVKCYHPGYTLVEKLQTISTKFRRQQEDGAFPKNFMRHYYDVYCLLQAPLVQAFIGSEAYHQHKAKRFRGGDNPVIRDNAAFTLEDEEVYALYRSAYELTSALYYRSQPSFDELIHALRSHVEEL